MRPAEDPYGRSEYDTMNTAPQVMRKRVLLTVLGTTPQSTAYTLNGREVSSNLAPVALFQLLDEDQRPDQVVALCTQDAKRISFPILDQALYGRCEVTCIEVPSGDDQETVNEFLAKAVQGVPSEDINIKLVVDITHGFRHLSILTYFAALYLVALREVHLEAAYYGLRCGEQRAPFLDLRQLLELPNWIYAINVLRETGSAQSIAKLLRIDRNAEVSRRLSRVSHAFLSGLPLELGQQAHVLVKQCKKPLRRELEVAHKLPLVDELISRLTSFLEPFALADSPSGDGWKGKVTLSGEELQREARIIDALFESEHISSALGLLREWTVSWVVWRLGRCNKWLDKGTRRVAENMLGTLAAWHKDLSPLLTEEQKKIGEFWKQLTKLRNAYHHNGMRRDDLSAKALERSISDVRHAWNTMIRSCTEEVSLTPIHDNGAILVTPLGMRPGVLFSALHACRNGTAGLPERCLVICSQQTENLALLAAEHAGFTGTLKRLLVDPFGGPAEVDRLVKAVRPIIFCSKQVFVNVTGGTTIMGLIAEAIAEEAKSLARPVRRFGLIDRRPSAEQDADPYQIGEAFWLDRESNDGDGDD